MSQEKRIEQWLTQATHPWTLLHRGQICRDPVQDPCWVSKMLTTKGQNNHHVLELHFRAPERRSCLVVWPGSSGLLKGFVLKVPKAPWKTHIVPDIDVRTFRQQQLHQVHVLVLSGPDHRCPTTIILSVRDRRCHHHRQQVREWLTLCSLLRTRDPQRTIFWKVNAGAGSHQRHSPSEVGEMSC